MVDNIPNMDEILAQMKENFLETAHEKLERMHEILELFISGQGQDVSLQEELRREVHSLKGLGGTFQMPMVSKLCYALETFLETEEHFDPVICAQSQVFVDRILSFMNAEAHNEDTLSTDWLAGLPMQKNKFS